jgi:hypothetical protein
MNEVSPKIVQKLQTLAQIAAELRQGKHFKVTRLTLLKSLCSDPEATAKFALHLAKRTLEKMKSQDCPSHITPEDWEQYQRLAAQAVRGMTKYLKDRTPEAESSLGKLWHVIRNAQSKFERQEWGLVRRIHSRELLTVETALECVLRPNASQLLAYDLARQYSERYNGRYGTGLIPESAPLVEDIAEFWGRHFLGRGWKKRLTK